MTAPAARRVAGNVTATNAVESYADQAIERWQRQQSFRMHGGRPGPHDPRFCECLVCADGREQTGQRALIPWLARRSLPEIQP